MQTHENLLVWQQSVEAVVALYKLTEKFPRREQYGLTSQMRRAAVSIPSNIAEGRRRATDADFRHFLTMAYGSLAELETQLLISRKLSFCTEEDYSDMCARLGTISKMLHGIIKSLKP